MNSRLFKHLPPAGMRFRPEFVLASGLFSGYAPVSPGTAGSIAFLLVWLALRQCGLLAGFGAQFALIVLVVMTGFLATECCLRRLYPDHGAISSHQKLDPQFIVIDEWAGMAISLLAVNQADIIWPLLALILFRIFDIAKPGPVRTMEALPGSAGIMLDDMLAGLMAWLSLQAVTFLVQ